ncbi:MAG: hypothetical protein H0U49_08035, partial [Parachlamydiaceae bacterium]|nr:hypothetical protein [Parachlamydiaceae bacterium]
MTVNMLSPLPIQAFWSDKEADSQNVERLKGFWKHVETNFQWLGKVYLQISENLHSFAFNGELIIESKRDFVNKKHCRLAALQGITIIAKKIRNQGIFLTKSGVTLNGNELVNDKGCINAASDIVLNVRNISNLSGEINSTEGQILWYGGHQVTLSNDHGTIFGQFGIRRINTHRKLPSSKSLPSILYNRHGKILAPEGPLEIFLNNNDNSMGLIEGLISNFDVQSFNNKDGRLFPLGDFTELKAALFENDGGLVVSSHGAIKIGGGIWENGSGGLDSALGIDISVQKFSNAHKGLLASREGAIIIDAVTGLKQQGKIVAAKGIHLSIMQGPFEGKDGHLITPHRLLVINAHTHLVELEGGILEAGAANLFGYEQINIKHSIFEIDGPLSITSETQWIEAQYAHFKQIGAAYFGAKESIYFENNKGNLSSLNINCKALSIEKASFAVHDDVDFFIDRFKGKNNALNVGGNVSVQATTSISSNDCIIEVFKGSIVQVSGEWVISQGDSITADVIRRDGKSVLIAQGVDEGRQIFNSGKEKLVLQKYRADAWQNLVLTGALALLKQNKWESEKIEVKADDLWLTEIEALFEVRLKLLANAQGVIRALRTEGRQLKVRVAEGGLSIYHAYFKNRESRLAAQAEVSVTKSTILGDCATTAGDSLYAADNVFAKGNVDLKSRHSNVNFSDSIMEGEDLNINAIEGSASLLGTKLEVNKLKLGSQKSTLNNVKVRSRGSIKSKSKDSRVSSSELNSNKKIIFDSEALLSYKNVKLESQRGTELLTDGLALIDKCIILGKAIFNAATAALTGTTVDAPNKSVEVDVLETFIARETLVQGQELLIHHQDSSLRTSEFRGTDSLTFDGRTRMSESNALSQKKIVTIGELLTLDKSKITVTDGDIKLATQSIFVEESSLQAVNITEEGDLLIAQDLQTLALSDHQRNIRKVSLKGGFDVANRLEENAEHIHRFCHKTVAKESIVVESQQINSYSSQFSSPQTLWKSETIIGDKNSFETAQLEINSKSAILYESDIQSGNTLLKINNILDLNQSSIKGNFQASGGDLTADRSSFTSDSNVSLNFESNVSLRESKIKTSRLEVVGDQIERYRSD